MKELQDLIAAWRAMPPGGKAVLATVVATTGSTYRKAGARMLITETGWAAGSVSGGCLEADVLSTAWDRTEAGPTLVTYDSTASDDIVWGFGLGCQGAVSVLFERLGIDGGVLPFLADCIESRTLGVLATVIDDGPELGRHFPVTEHTSAASGTPSRAKDFLGSRNHVIENGVLFESILPPLALTIFGAGHDAIPLSAAGLALGWHVTVIDHRESFADAKRFPGASVKLIKDIDNLEIEPGSVAVVMSHNYERDLAVMRQLLPLPLAYLGQLGPRVRTNRILQELAAGGLQPTPSQLEKLFAPIGLDLGASSPEEIALAVVAEIQGVINQRDGASLRSSEKCLASR